jgi:hypothetical protein
MVLCWGGVEVVKWTKTKDKTPDKSGSYLCWYVDGFGNSGFWVGYWDENRKGFFPKWHDNQSRYERYWMLLPEKPKGE